MESIRKLRDEMQFTSDLSGLLDILKGIAVAEYWALENKKERFSPFLESFEEFFYLIDFHAADHPFAQDRGNLGIIVITTNEGFMGGLNNRVVNAALNAEGAQGAEFIVIGERGAGYLKAMGRKIIEFPGINVDRIYELSIELKDFIIKESLDGRFGRLKLFYPKAESFMVQRIKELTLLPCYELFEKLKKSKTADFEVINDSNVADIIEYLVEAWISQKLFEVLEDSKLAEFSARTLHLEESFQLSLEKQKIIKNRYFKINRELVDKGLRDMFSSQIIKKKRNSCLKVNSRESKKHG